MRTRKQIAKEANKQHDIISQAKKQLIELQKEDYLLCDKEQWFTEEEETIGRGKSKETRLCGRIHWKQSFFDEDKPKKPIIIERSDIVRINGVWQF